MAKEPNPLAELEPHEGDLHLSPELLMQLSLFSGLKDPPPLERYPGAIVVRRFRKEYELFRQGEAGWTAFYILTLDDILLIQQARLRKAVKENLVQEARSLTEDIAKLTARKQERTNLARAEEARRAATVYIATLKRGYVAKDSSVRRLIQFTSRPSGPDKNREQQTFYLPEGGPRTFSYEAGKAPLSEGDLFGEMSCLYLIPRTATVVTDRECWMIECLRNILTQVYEDPVYKQKADDTYLKRVFELHFRQSALFADLQKSEFDEIRAGVELVSKKPGEIVFDEHERSDAMYLVRQGLIKVMKNVSHMVGPQDVTEFVAIAKCLKVGETLAGSPASRFWALLPEKAKAILRLPELERIGPADRSEVVYSVNDVLKNRTLIDAPEFKQLVAGDDFRSSLGKVPADKRKWEDEHVRRHNRLVLESICPNGLRQRSKHSGVETILSYCATNQHFGEIGLMLGQPRSATCVAFSHPNYAGSIKLVKITSEAFWKLVKMSPTIRDRIKTVIAERRRHTIATLARPVWEQAGQVQFSEQFAQLGLIQGQKLMLIDLDRCTRCDECVKACVENHKDGNTRLFLEGPRFGKYLVPTSCRSCLDPVCMVDCPVDSIHRGNNKQMMIESWCIGCKACSNACPYGSIQRHDLGLIPETARGWRWLPASHKSADGAWTEPGFKDADWLKGASPFVWNRETQDGIRTAMANLSRIDALTRETVCFRREFDAPRLKPDAEFRVTLVSRGSEVKLWINGRELAIKGQVRQGRHEFPIPPVQDDKGKAGDYLRVGTNLLAAQVKASCKGGEILFQLRLDEVKRPDLPNYANVAENVAEEIAEAQVSFRAVVCDMCSSLPGQQPACVHACPHDAAVRVDARTNFPSS